MQKILSIISPYDDWFNDSGKNLEAKQSLYCFYKEFKKLIPEEKYRKKLYHSDYLNYLVKIKEAFMEKKYMRVCNELISLIHYEPCLQGRIYYNIIKVLEDGLEIRKGE